MPTAQKIDRVAELKANIEGSTALLLTDYRGLTVSEISELRRALSEAKTRLAVVKNTLMQLAVAEAGMQELRELLSGPSAVAFVGGDPVAAAKKIAAASKQFPALFVKGGWMDGRMLSGDEARALADLDTREVMLSKIAGLLQTEIARAASVFQATQARFLALLDAYKAKVPSDGEVTTEQADPVAEAAEETTEETTEAQDEDPSADGDGDGDGEGEE
jgi:large subunit ribosomal protein L10